MLNVPPSTDKYYFEIVRNQHKNELKTFLCDNFRVDESLNRASNISVDEISGCLDGAIDRSLKDTSIIARDKVTNEIVGCMMSSIWKRDESVGNTPEDEEKDFEFATIRKEVAMVGEILNELHGSFWTLRPDQNVVLHFEISSVSKHHQRQGLASTFLNWTENPELLKSVGATGIATEASSLANQVLLAKRGYEIISTTLLDTKVDRETGKPILICDDGTDRVNLMFKSFP